jgi:hypothetical protein
MLALGTAGVGWTASLLAVNGGHILLEIQEAMTDALFGTHNVRGVWDTGSDLAAGLATTVAIWWLVSRSRLPATLRSGRGTPRARARGRRMKQPAVPPPT